MNGKRVQRTHAPRTPGRAPARGSTEHERPPSASTAARAPGKAPAPGADRDSDRRPARGADRGTVWERRAGDYLQRRGLRVLMRRYRCRLGELDLVCLDKGALVIVEVRARARSRFADAGESVDIHKQRKLVRATRHLLMTHPHWSGKPLRFDVLCIDGIDGADPAVRWIRNAFDGGSA